MECRDPPRATPGSRRTGHPADTAGGARQDLADVSQYQITPVTDAYPYDIFCFRSNSGNMRDTKFAANHDWAVRACQDGRLRFFIVYWFFRPGQANIDLLMQMVTEQGGPHPRMVVMADVEDAAGAITGDQSAGATTRSGGHANGSASGG